MEWRMETQGDNSQSIIMCLLSHQLYFSTVAIICDVEFRKGHVPGTVLLPYLTLKPNRANQQKMITKKIQKTKNHHPSVHPSPTTDQTEYG